MATNGTAVARREASDALALLDREDVRARIAAFLPKGVDPARVAASVSLALNDPKTGPALRKCEPASIVRAAGRIAQWGLEIGVTAYLVPFGRECTPVADYKGLIELVVGSGAARAVDAHAVFEGDVFEYELGLEPKLVHQPRWTERGTRKVVAAYAIARIRFGYTQMVVMPADEIDAIRQQYSKQWKSGPLPDWYAVKTVVRRLTKLLPQNPRLADALRKIEDEQAVELGEGIELPATYTVRSQPSLPAAPVEHEPRNLRADAGTYGDEADVESPSAPMGWPAGEPDPYEGSPGYDDELTLDDTRPRRARRNAQED